NDPQNQKNLPTKITYGVTTKAATAMIDPKVLPNLATAPQNIAAALYINDKFWLENLDKLNQRFNAWVAKLDLPRLVRATAVSMAPTVPGADTATALRRALKRSGRKEQLRAAALVLPLLLFLLATFIVPIGAMLGRAFFDREVAEIMPRVTSELARWDGRTLPPDAAYAALIEDVRAAREAGTLASAATRLNYDVAGFRSLLFATGRRLGGEAAGSPREILGAIDPKWNDLETWA